MTDEQRNEENSPLVSRIPIRVAQLGELKAYVIYEHELDALDKLDEDLTKDPPDSVYLNFALFLLPISISFLVTLLTTTIQSNRVYELFLIICILAFIVSLVLFALWRRDRQLYHQTRKSLLKEREKQIQKIKSRMPPNPVTETILLEQTP